MANAKVGASAGWHGNFIESVTFATGDTTYNIVPGDCGKTFILKGIVGTINLPALADVDPGYQLTIIWGATADYVIGNGGGLIKGLAAITAGPAIQDLSGKSTIEPDTGAQGDHFKFVTDGSNWYVTGYSGTAIS